MTYKHQNRKNKPIHFFRHTGLVLGYQAKSRHVFGALFSIQLIEYQKKYYFVEEVLEMSGMAKEMTFKTNLAKYLC